MSSQLGGYVFDIPYEDNFYRDLTPRQLEAVLLLSGIALPTTGEQTTGGQLISEQAVGAEPFRYLELGFGQGMSLNVHAAACEGEFWGTDFNPTHCLVGRTLSERVGSKAQFLNDSFEELYRKSVSGNLPQFDMICLHGVWSWMNEENRNYILKIISSNLKVGGAVFVSYNCMPGWADFAPLRELLSYHAKLESSTKGSLSKLQGAYNFVSLLEQSGAHYFERNPGAAAKFKSLGDRSISYLAHEYLNEDWSAPYFKDVAEAFEQVKCTFVTSTRLLGQLNIAMPEGVQKLLAGITDVKLRETVRDFALNKQFRRDVYVKGARGFAPDQRMTEKTYFALCVQKEAVSFEITVPGGQLQLREDLYKPVADYLAQDNYRPKSIAEIHSVISARNSDFTEQMLMEILAVFVGANYVHLSYADLSLVSDERKEMCKKLNTELCERALIGLNVSVLASPLLGGGVSVSSMEMMLLLAKRDGSKTAKQMSEAVFELLKQQGRNIQKEGETLDHKAGVAELLGVAKNLLEHRLPLLQALGVEI